MAVITAILTFSYFGREGGLTLQANVSRIGLPESLDH
jgi:hypothetical protein